MSTSDALLIVSLVGCVSSAGLLGYSSYVAALRQKQAYAGDQTAAKYIVLPCYKPIIKGMVVFYLLFALALLISVASPGNDADSIVQYLGFCLIVVFSITPVLLVQSSVSIRAFRNLFLLLFPWWAISTVLWIAGTEVERGSAALLGVFTALACIPPMALSIGILTKRVKSRVQLGSRSNRNTPELLLSYSALFAAFMVFRISYGSSGIVALVFGLLTFGFNQLFPWMNHRTLLADTKFWRGLGRHNQGGLDIDDNLRESGVDVHRPTMELNFVTSSLQSAMSEVRGLAVDFAYLQLQQMIGQGATAKVYMGKYRNKVVAIKLSTPPEVDEEVINTFIAEANLSSSLKHRNIVEFVGICIRPPQIGMVFEFCEGGNLKTSLTKQAAQWTAMKRLRACHGAASAVSFMHSQGYIHRDIKADNFFVAKKLVVKLGDFGESTHMRTKESADAQRMTILGTVAFMAPELIAADRYYTSAVDIYALAVTFWEIWTGRDPYDDSSTFDIYDKVKKGQRPPVPDDAPDGFKALLGKCWAGPAEERLTGPDIVATLEGIIEKFKSATHTVEEDSASSGVDGGEETTRSSAYGFMETFSNRLSTSLRGSVRGPRRASQPTDKDMDRDLEEGGAGDDDRLSTLEMQPTRRHEEQVTSSPIHSAPAPAPAVPAPAPAIVVTDKDPEGGVCSPIHSDAVTADSSSSSVEADGAPAVSLGSGAEDSV